MTRRVLGVLGLALVFGALSVAPAQAACPTFAYCTAYAAGTVVTYNGSNYTAGFAIAANRDCSAYTPATDNWWTAGGSCGTGPTATSTATATAKTPTPTATATNQSGCTPTTITPYVQVNGGSWSQTSSATVAVGSSVTFGPQPVTGGSWGWSGPNGYSSTSRQVTISSSIQSSQAGNYFATYTNASGCKSTQTFTVTVTGGTPTPTATATTSNGCTPTTITPYVQVNGGSWSQTSSATVSAGSSVTFGPQPVTGGSWSWSGPNGYSSTSRQVTISSSIQPNQAGSYVATYTNTGGCKSTQTFTVAVSGTGTPTPTPTTVSSGSINLHRALYVMPYNSPVPITQYMNETGLKSYMMAFILAGGGCTPLWDGTTAINDGVASSMISAIRSNGGDVAVSQGGYNGTKLGQACSGGTGGGSAYAAFQSVVSAYNFKAVDFDIEEPEIESITLNGSSCTGAVCNELDAVAQFANEGLTVSITMPTLTTGLNYFGGLTAQAMAAKGICNQSNVHVRIMPFDGGFTQPGGTESALQALQSQMMNYCGWSSSTAWSRIGVSGMLGISDTGEFTQLADWQNIISFVNGNGMPDLTTWAEQRDTPCLPKYGSVDPGTKGDCSSVNEPEGAFGAAMK